MNSLKIRIILWIACSIGLAGCGGAEMIVANAVMAQATKPKIETTVDAEEDKSALETRAIQRKEIDAGYRMTFRSAMDVLHDMGFTITQTNMETGHLIGMKKIPITTTVSTFMERHETKMFIPQESTVTMEKWGRGKTRLRVATDLGKIESGINLSGADKARYLQADKFYEEFFANLSKAVFLRKENL